jgi:catechol 2,3-dioxygenase
MTTIPLDVDSLLGELADPATDEYTGVPDGTRVGHTHLCVADVAATVQFYREVLGFDLMAQLGPMAAFLSAGGYHHHIGANTWESRGAPPAPAGTARLLRATIVLPDEDELARVAERAGGTEISDPSGNPLFLTV